MSQLPSDPRAMTAVRQNRTASPTPGDFQNSLVVSNTPVVAAVDSVSPVTQGLAQTLAAAAGLVSDLGRDAELKRYRESVRAAEEARLSEQQRKDLAAQQKASREAEMKAQRGIGKATLETQLQLYQERVKRNDPIDNRRSLLTDVEVNRVPQEIVPILNEMLPPEMDSEVRTELLQDFVPKFTGLIAARRSELALNKEKTIADGNGSDNADPSVPVADVYKSFTTMLAAAEYITPSDAFTRIVTNPAKAAAQAGDVERVTEFVKLSPDEYRADLLPLIDQAKTNQQQIRNDRVRTIKDAIARSTVLFDATGDQTYSPRSQLAFLDEVAINNPDLAGEIFETRQTLKGKIERDAEQYAKEQQKRNDELSIAQQREYVQQFANDAVTVGDRSFFAQDQEIVRESTGEVTERLTGNDLLRDSMRRYFAVIDSNEQFDPQTRTRLKLEKSRQLAYVDNTWSQEHTAGYRAISQASVQNVGGQFTVPEVTRSAARLHLAMRDTYPNAIQLSGDERLFYDRVVANMLNPAVGGNEQALDAAIAKAATDSFSPIDTTLSDVVKEIGTQLTQERSFIPFLNYKNPQTLTQAANRRYSELVLANHPDPKGEAERDLRARTLNVKGFGFVMERPIPSVGNRQPAELLEEQIDALVEQYASVNLNEDGDELEDTDVLTVQDPVTGFIRFFDSRTNSLVRTGSDETGNDRFVAPLTVDELARRAKEKDTQAISASTRLAAQRQLQFRQEEQLAKMAEKARGNSESSRELYYRRGY